MNPLNDLLNQLDGQVAPQELAPVAPVEQATVATENLPVIDVRAQVDRASSIADEIIASWRSDRVEAQRAAVFVKDIIDDITAKQQTPSAALIEQYLRALEIKADTNSTVVKCVDNIAKLISATKQSAHVVNSVSISSTHQELIEILSNPANDIDP